MQIAYNSWWPTPTHWDNLNACGLNWGHWTQFDEEWYLSRLRDIAKGAKDGVPLSGNTWRSKLRGMGAVRIFTKHVSDSSKEVFNLANW